MERTDRTTAGSDALWLAYLVDASRDVVTYAKQLAPRLVSASCDVSAMLLADDHDNNSHTRHAEVIARLAHVAEGLSLVRKVMMELRSKADEIVGGAERSRAVAFLDRRASRFLLMENDLRDVWGQAAALQSHINVRILERATRESLESDIQKHHRVIERARRRCDLDR